MGTLASIKALKTIFGDDAKRARDILTGDVSPMEFETAKHYVKTCFSLPSQAYVKMMALNELGGFAGVERYDGHLYLKTGGQVTLVRKPSGAYRVMYLSEVIGDE